MKLRMHDRGRDLTYLLGHVYQVGVRYRDRGTEMRCGDFADDGWDFGVAYGSITAETVKFSRLDNDKR